MAIMRSGQFAVVCWCGRSHVHAWVQAVKGCRDSSGFMESGPEQASWLQRMRGSAYVAPHELLSVWRSDFEASGLQHSPASFTALVQVCCSQTRHGVHMLRAVLQITILGLCKQLHLVALLGHGH